MTFSMLLYFVKMPKNANFTQSVQEFLNKDSFFDHAEFAIRNLQYSHKTIHLPIMLS